MLDAPAIVARLLADIRCVYDRPLMHGGTAEGAELVLRNLHTTLAACLEVEEQYRAALTAQQEREGHQAMSCSGYFASSRPAPTEEEKAAYVVGFFKRLDAAVGLLAMTDHAQKPEPPDAMDSR